MYISRWSNIAFKKIPSFYFHPAAKRDDAFLLKINTCIFWCKRFLFNAGETTEAFKRSIQNKTKTNKKCIFDVLMRIVFLTFSQGISFCVVRQYLDDAIVVLQPNFFKYVIFLILHFFSPEKLLRSLIEASRIPANWFSGNFPCYPLLLQVKIIGSTKFLLPVC